MPINRIAHSSTEIDIENYISILRTGQLVSDTGWRTYANTAGVNPVTGIGGAANITWSQNNTDPHNGEADLRLVKDANNRQGEGVSIDFTIDNRHLSKVLQITFDTELISGNYESPIIAFTTGTYSITSTTCTVTASHSFIQGQVVNMTFTSGTVPPNGTYVITSTTATTFVFTVASGSGIGNCSYTVPADMRVSVIQDPNGTPVVIEPVNTGISLGISNPRQRVRHIATFQTHISLRTYRLCIHVANASTVAYTVDFANFRVWEPNQSIGAVITEPQIYTQIIKGGTTDPGKGSGQLESATWHREGKNLIIRYNLRIGTGSAGSGVYYFLLPNGLSVDYSLVVSGGLSGMPVVGAAHIGGGAISIIAASAVLPGASAPYPNSIIIVGNDGTNPVGSAYYSLGNANMTYGFQATIPIQGWGSSVTMSSDSGDSRVVALNLSGSSQQNVSVTANVTKLIFGTTSIEDTHSAWSNNNTYTVPVTGWYSIQIGHVYVSSAETSTTIALFKNGANVGSISASYPNDLRSGGRTFYFNAGDLVDFRYTASRTIFHASAFLSLSRVNTGSQVIATQETVFCNYINTTSQSLGASATKILFPTRVTDSHGSWDTSLNRFTAPISGTYLIAASYYNNVSSSRCDINDFRKNGTAITNSYTGNSTGTNAAQPVGIHIVTLIAGDFLEVFGSTSGASINQARVFISRIGNYT